MRTTLTIEDDVARALDRLRHERKVALKPLVNEVLRAGLMAIAKPKPARGARFRTKAVDGKPRVTSFDDISMLVSLAEGESHR